MCCEGKELRDYPEVWASVITVAGQFAITLTQHTMPKADRETFHDTLLHNFRLMCSDVIKEVDSAEARLMT